MFQTCQKWGVHLQILDCHGERTETTLTDINALCDVYAVKKIQSVWTN